MYKKQELSSLNYNLDMLTIQSWANMNSIKY